MSGVLWFSFLAGIAPLIASIIPFIAFKNGINPRSFQILLGLSCGLLFSIATLELIPEAISMAQITIEDAVSLNTHMSEDNNSKLDDNILNFNNINNNNGIVNDLDNTKTLQMRRTTQLLHIFEKRYMVDEPLEKNQQLDLLYRSQKQAIQSQQTQTQQQDTGNTLLTNTQTTNTNTNTNTNENKNTHTDHHHEKEKEERNIRIAMMGIGTGFFFLVVVEQIMASSGLAHSHAAPDGGKTESDDEEELAHSHQHNAKPPSLRSSLSAVAFVGLAIHSLIDGMIIAGAFAASPEVGSRVALAILLHKFPDGFVMSSIVASQQSRFQNVHPITYVILISAMTPIGALLGIWLLGSFSTVAVAFILGFGAGTFLFITAGGILPELLQTKGSNKIISLASIVAGYLGFLLIDTSLHAH